MRDSLDGLITQTVIVLLYLISETMSMISLIQNLILDALLITVNHTMMS